LVLLLTAGRKERENPASHQTEHVKRNGIHWRKKRENTYRNLPMHCSSGKRLTNLSVLPVEDDELLWNLPVRKRGRRL